MFFTKGGTERGIKKMKKKIVVIFVMMLLIAWIPCISGNEKYREDDPYEPNDIFEDAAEIIVGYYPDLNCSDPDWYKITVDENMTLTVTIYFNHANGDLDLWLYDSGQMELMHSLSATDNEIIIFITDNLNRFQGKY